MISLVPTGEALSVLCLGAHPDDIEVGCGGALLTLAERPRTTVSGVVLTGDDARTVEAKAALPQFFPGASVEVLGLRDGRLPAYWNEAKEALESVAAFHAPDVVLAPRPDDAHQDHRLVGQLATTVWRDALVLHYEIPKWDGDLTRMTHYVRLSEEEALRKVELLNKCFPSQVHRDWWDDDFFLGLLRIRGAETRSRHAEAFLAPKALLDLGGARR